MQLFKQISPQPPITHLFMKKILLLAALLSSTVASIAQLNGNGYYRVQNVRSSRYAYVTDNRGSVNFQTTSADVNALQLWKNPEKATYDPSAIIYFEKHGAEWDLMAQNTSVYSIIQVYVSIYRNSDGTYMCYGKNSGMAKYLGDIDTSDDDMGIMSIDAQGISRKWYIKPMTTDGANYLGIKPTMQARGKHYTPYFTSFPYKAHSPGVKFYTVSRIENGLAVIKEINDVVPANTPVIAECSTDVPTTNRLAVGGTRTDTASIKNQLQGVYFYNTMASHLNRTKFDPATMRALAVSEEGKLVYTNAPSFEYIPANYSYLHVPAGSPAVMRVVTEDELEAETALIPTSIALSQSALSLSIGESTQLQYTILPATAASDKVTWTSSNSDVVTVSADGTVTAHASGTATITVSTSNNLKAKAVVSVTAMPTSISVSPAASYIYEGATQQLVANVLPSDAVDKSVTWTSSNPAVATVSTTGLVTAVLQGTCNITATTVNGKTATATINVLHRPVPVESVTISATSLTLNISETATLTATVNPSNADDRTVVWTSTNPAIVSVNSEGVVTALSSGTAVVKASAGGKSASCKVTVNRPAVPVESITLNRTEAQLVIGAQTQLVATINPANADSTNVTWTSSNPTVATVDYRGRVTAAAVGQAVVTASCDGKSATCSITVKRPAVPVTDITLSQTMLSVEEGSSAQLVATVSPDNADDKTVVWISSDPTIATVDSTGLVTGIKPGWTSITATSADLIAMCTVQVTKRPVVHVNGITLSPSAIEDVIGTEVQLAWEITPANATDKSVTFTSSNETVATVSEQGLVTVTGNGNAVIRVQTVDGEFWADCNVIGHEPVVHVTDITVTPSTFEGIVGSQVQLLWVVSPADATDTSVAITSTNENVATVTSTGLVTIVSEGVATIRFTTNDGGFVAECNINAVSGFDDIVVDAKGAPLYNIHGLMIKPSVTSTRDLEGLPYGIYILGGHKIIL